jgi:hypothetical protein
MAKAHMDRSELSALTGYSEAQIVSWERGRAELYPTDLITLCHGTRREAGVAPVLGAPPPLMSGATLAAGTTDEPRLYVGQPEIIGPAITTDRNRMAAAVVSAIDQQATHALFAHVGKGDFLRGGGASTMIAPIMSRLKPLRVGPVLSWYAMR